MHATHTLNDPAAEFSDHEPWLRTVLSSRLSSREEVDEVLQEIALAASTHSAKRGTVDRPGPWLYRVALRQVLLMRRKQGRRRKLMTGAAENLEVTEHCTKTRSPLDWILSEERGTQVQATLATLSERDRQLLLLKYIDGFSYEEIGDTLGVTAASVQSRLHRARKILRERLVSAQVVDSESVA
ncbi:MAG: RNA polymerase sigma factor [Pirellulales bacterium]